MMTDRAFGNNVLHENEERGNVNEVDEDVSNVVLVA